MFGMTDDQGAHGSMQTYECRLCGQTGNSTTHVAWEMMFGLGESFTYFECDSCGSLQIDHIPENMAPYYPENYYSLAARDSGPPSGWRKIWDRTSAVFSLKGPNHWLPAVKHREIYEWLKNAGVHFNSSILDVGCGSGALLLRLRNDGFTDLTGYEPHIPDTLSYEGNVTVHNQVDQVEGRFDLVMLHHSLEHMPDQHSAFQRLAGWVKPGGKLLPAFPSTPMRPGMNTAQTGFSWMRPDTFISIRRRACGSWQRGRVLRTTGSTTTPKDPNSGPASNTNKASFTGHPHPMRNPRKTRSSRRSNSGNTTGRARWPTVPATEMPPVSSFRKTGE